MRVLYVSPYPPARDGIGTYTRVLASAVRARGHEIAVLTAHPHGQAPPEVIGALGILGGSSGLRDAVAGFAPDVVHVQFAVPAFGARAVAVARWLKQTANLPVPVVATLHEVTRDIALLHGPGRTLYQWITTHCDHVVVHTQAALDTLTGQVGVAAAQTEVIPHFSTEPPTATSTAEEQRARFGLDDGRILLAFGFIHVDKGLDVLVRALGILRRTDPGVLHDVHVVVAGTVRRRHGPFRIFEVRDRLHLAHVRSLARRNGLSRRMVFAGFVPDGDIAAWFAAAEAIVLPYRSAEQSGVANLARAFGVPVIASTAGGLAELFAESRWTVPPGSPNRLAAAIADFLSHDHSVSSQGPHKPRPPVDAHGRTADLDTVATRTVTMYDALRARTQGKDSDAG